MMLKVMELKPCILYECAVSTRCSLTQRVLRCFKLKMMWSMTWKKLQGRSYSMSLEIQMHIRLFSKAWLFRWTSSLLHYYHIWRIMWSVCISLNCTQIRQSNSFYQLYGFMQAFQSMVFQSLIRLKEPSVLLRCREMDLNVVNSVLEEAKREYAKKTGAQAPSIVVDQVHLPPPPPHDGTNSIGPSWWVMSFCSFTFSCIISFMSLFMAKALEG